jgi:hypothetical protein
MKAGKEEVKATLRAGQEKTANQENVETKMDTAINTIKGKWWP